MKRPPRALATALLLAALAAACSSSSSTPAAVKDVTLMLNWTPNNHHAGIYVAQQEGFYKAAGLNVKIIEPADSGVEGVVGSGGAEFGLAQAESLLPARAAGIPVVSIGTVLPHNDSSLMALASSGIKRPKDLEGHTYGGYGGALEKELISQLVTCDGGDPSKVKFVDVGNVDYLAGFDSKKFDFVWVFSGWDALRATAVEKRDISEIRFADWQSCIPDWYTPLFLTNEKMIANSPATVKAFMSATAKGYAVAASDPARAAKDLIAGAPGTDAALAAASAAYYAPKYAPAGSRWGVQSADVWKRFGAFAVQAKLLESAVDTTKAFTNDFLPTGG